MNQTKALSTDALLEALLFVAQEPVKEADLFSVADLSQEEGQTGLDALSDPGIGCQHHTIPGSDGDVGHHRVRTAGDPPAGGDHPRRQLGQRAADPVKRRPHRESRAR